MAKRLLNWDYSRQGAYFITICVKNMRCDLGAIENAQPVLSTIGKKVEDFWLELSKHAPNAVAGEYVIMPNHFHGIVYIVEGPLFDINKNIFGMPISGSVSVIIGGFKAAVKKWCGENGLDFEWKRSFHDSIIRNEQHHQNVLRYIENNPIKWEIDKGEHPDFPDEFPPESIQ